MHEGFHKYNIFGFYISNYDYFCKRLIIVIILIDKIVIILLFAKYKKFLICNSLRYSQIAHNLHPIIALELLYR